MATKDETATADAPDFLSRLTTVQVGPRTESAGTDDTPTLTIPALAPYAGMNKLGSEIESWRKGEGGKPVRDAAWDHYITEGIKAGKAPANIKGVDGDNVAVATIPLVRKDDRTRISPEDAERFTKLNIRLGRKEYAPATLRMKPDIWQDKGKAIFGKLLALCDANPEICAVLSEFGVDSIVDLFEIQAENAYTIVGNDTIDDIFLRAKEARALHAQGAAVSNENPFDDAMVRELLEKVGDPRTTVRQFYGDLPGTLVLARKQLCPTKEDIEEEMQAEAEARKAREAKAAAAAPADVVEPARSSDEPLLGGGKRARRK